MVISAINSVSFRGSRRINREDRKSVEYNPNLERHVSSPLKAVPLVVLLAMSPMNTVDAGQYNYKISQIENINQVGDSGNKGTLINSLVFDDKIAQGRLKEVVNLISTDGNNQTAEQIQLTIHRPNYTHYIKNPKIIIIGSGGRDYSYWAYGSGYKKKHASGLLFEREHIIQKIGSEELVEFLKDFESDKKVNNNAFKNSFVFVDVKDNKDVRMIDAGQFDALSPELRQKLLK